MDKKQLYENIMSNVAKHVKHAINENVESLKMGNILSDLRDYGLDLPSIFRDTWHGDEGATTSSFAFDQVQDKNIKTTNYDGFVKKFTKFAGVKNSYNEYVTLFILKNDEDRIVAKLGAYALTLYFSNGNSADLEFRDFKNQAAAEKALRDITADFDMGSKRTITVIDMYLANNSRWRGPEMHKRTDNGCDDSMSFEERVAEYKEATKFKNMDKRQECLDLLDIAKDNISRLDPKNMKDVDMIAWNLSHLLMNVIEGDHDYCRGKDLPYKEQSRRAKWYNQSKDLFKSGRY